MSGENLYSRPDQIAELTSGIQFPLAPLHDLHLDLIAEMLARAWGDLLHSNQPTLMTGSEAEINALMVTRLNILIDADGSLSNMIRIVTRGTETVSFDGSQLETRPDISIHLTDRKRNFPLVVECKIIEPTKAVDLYCKTGIIRFVRGKYAWAVCESFMLAYARDGSSIKSSLIPFLMKHRKTKPDPYRTESIPKPVSHATFDLAKSRHGRIFKYPDGLLNSSPGPINLWHLWVEI